MIATDGERVLLSSTGDEGRNGVVYTIRKAAVRVVSPHKLSLRPGLLSVAHVFLGVAPPRAAAGGG